MRAIFVCILTTIQLWLGLNWPSTSQQNATSLPALALDLVPRWSPDNTTIQAVNATLTISGRRFEHDESFLQMVLEVGRVPSMDYRGNEFIRASDDLGPLRLIMSDKEGVPLRSWSAGRDTVGDIVLDFTVYPRLTNKATPPGPRIDFRDNSGGLIGTGNVFVPTVLDGSAETLVQYNLTVNWDLSRSPHDTRTVWTFGEGTSSTRTGPAETLVNTVYMIGRTLSSWSHPDLAGYGFYWLTTPPRHLMDDPSLLAEQISKLYPQMSEFFETPGEAYRVFLRESPRGYGGSAYTWSFMLEWDQGIRLGKDDEDKQGKEEDLYFLVSHEMVHNWPTMQGVEGGQEDPNATWYEEGIATYYQAVLPYELGLITEDRFIVQLNNILSSYYTSPAIHMSSVECSEKAWSDNNAQRLPYYRGVLYLLHIDAEIRKQTEGKKSLRDSSIKLIQLRLAGLPYTFEEWLNIIGADIDRDYALRLFMDMSAGNWVVPPPTGLFGDGIVPVRQDQYVFEDGFVRQTQGNQTVFTNVTRGSRADLAGLKIGDRMTWSKYRNGALDDYSRNVSYTVTCEVGDEREIAYWPRGFKEVENWQYGRKARSV